MKRIAILVVGALVANLAWAIAAAETFYFVTHDVFDSATYATAVAWMYGVGFLPALGAISLSTELSKTGLMRWWWPPAIALAVAVAGSAAMHFPWQETLTVFPAALIGGLSFSPFGIWADRHRRHSRNTSHHRGNDRRRRGQTFRKLAP